MAILLTEDNILLGQKVSAFAQDNIAAGSGLITQDTFPFDIWKEMGRQGLLGIGADREFGGLGGGYFEIGLCGKAIVEAGHVMGLGLSCLMHQIVTRFFFVEPGNEKHKELYLRDLACGKITAGLAISEPGRGAHPKYLETTALRDGRDYILNGEKTYITNGPIADLFIVLAITGSKGDKRRFTAFIVPGDTTGLSKTKPMTLPFLKPCPHGGISLKDCRVPSENIVWEAGNAYEEISPAFREIEDAMMMGPIIGALRCRFKILLGLVRDERIETTKELKGLTGEIQAIIQVFEILAYEAAAMIDSRAGHEEFVSILIYFRQEALRLLPRLERIVSIADIRTDGMYGQITDDLVGSIKIAANAAYIKQVRLGEALLA